MFASGLAMLAMSYVGEVPGPWDEVGLFASYFGCAGTVANSIRLSILERREKKTLEGRQAMLKRQFADFLTTQIKSKLAILETETTHSAVQDLKSYIEQLDGIFAAVLSQRDVEPQPKKRGKKQQSNDAVRHE